MNIVEVTTYYRRYRHFSTNTAEQAGCVGEIGTALCSGDAVFDQDRLDWLFKGTRRKRIVIADLPLCKRCVKTHGVIGGAR